MAFRNTLLGQSDEAVVAVILIAYLAIIVVTIVGMWKTFEKANQPGWGCIVPIYNVIVILKVAGKPLWWLILMVIPIANLIPAILIPLAVAKNFRKGVGFGIGLLLLPFVFYPILGLGNAEYDPEVPLF